MLSIGRPSFVPLSHTNPSTIRESLTTERLSESKSISSKWSNAVYAGHRPILKVLHCVTGRSARHPKCTISLVLLLSFTVLIAGLLTNFRVDVDQDTLWAPKNARSIRHKRWIENESGFPERTRPFYMFFHADGANVLGQNQLMWVFEALDLVRDLPGYDTMCAQSVHGSGTCPIHGVVDFFNESAALFQQQVQSDEEAISALSAMSYPDGRPVDPNEVLGNYVRDPETNRLVSAESLSVSIEFPDISMAEDLESAALDRILSLDEQWMSDPSIEFRVEVQAESSFGEEFARAIVNDIPLVPLVFVIMSLFNCIAFAKCDKLQSRSLLGLGAVVSVLLSLISGYGFMFLCGVPFTSMTQILPFIIFGIGLDDAFILHGSFMRTDHTQDPTERIHRTVDDVGISVTLTTITSTLAFGLGCLSTIPSIFWLCLYAFVTVFIIFVYQMTFFVACVVIDERRIANRRRDCCVWVRVVEEDNRQEEAASDAAANTRKEAWTDRVMQWYGERLLQPTWQCIVIVLFAALAVGSAYSASQLRQEFDFTDVVPDDSYLIEFFDAYTAHTTISGMMVFAYFRHVDQSDAAVQQQMHAYVDDLLEMDAIEQGPEFFWLSDFQEFVAENASSNETFIEQMDRFLEDPVYQELYQDHIVRNETGTVLESRVGLRMDNVDVEDVTEQIDTLQEQDQVTASQTINQGQRDWPFFTYGGMYDIWEFYATSVSELTFNTIMGVIAVTGVALVMVPHWSAVCLTFPLICLLYVDLLGFMQWRGVKINAVSYVTLVMSIGLLVDYLMHVLLRYYESVGDRRTRALHVLRTMGSSILLGAVSTFLGILPLALSTSTIFHTVFISFFGLVVLGASHGLVLLPVLLSLVGPQSDNAGQNATASTQQRPNEEEDEMTKQSCA